MTWVAAELTRPLTLAQLACLRASLPVHNGESNSQPHDFYLLGLDTKLKTKRAPSATIAVCIIYLSIGRSALCFPSLATALHPKHTPPSSYHAPPLPPPGFLDVQLRHCVCSLMVTWARKNVNHLTEGGIGRS